MKRARSYAWLTAILLLICMMAVVACTGSNDKGSSSGGDEVVLPEPNENGVITAEQWAEIHPDIYASYMANDENDQVASYIDANPFIVTLYGPSGFAVDYSEARGHTYTLADVDATKRPHALANCLTCKSPEMIAMVNGQGDGVYSTDFTEIYAKVGEPISCYNCHANTNGELVVVSPFLTNALGSDAGKAAAGAQACGQCHIEYYFDPATKATTLPWNGLAQMTPDEILAYYNDMGFTDFTNATSGAAMIKVQHPEFETVLGDGSVMDMMGDLSCPDCHMGSAINADGVTYTNHTFQSPLANEQLMTDSCNTGGFCHTDLAGEVADIQAQVTARETVIGQKLAELHTRIGEAAANGTMSEAELAELRQTVRDAQFYWDFCFVENSEGAHNSVMAKYLLDKAEELVDEGLAKF